MKYKEESLYGIEKKLTDYINNRKQKGGKLTKKYKKNSKNKSNKNKSNKIK